MKLIPNWKSVALRSWSMWAVYAGLALLVLPEIRFAFWGVDTNPYVTGYAGLGLLVLGAFGRLVDQGIDAGRTWSHAGALLLAMGALTAAPQVEGAGQVQPGPAYSLQEFDAVAVPLIAKWEGLRLEAYQDIVGVWTVCYGETKGVRPGDRHTKAECDAMLAREIRSYRAGLHGFFAPQTVKDRLTAEQDAAYTSLAYNAGIAAIGRSTATRRVNAGYIAGGCQALTWWNKAGGRVIRGLINRRADEFRLCMKGLT